MHMCIYVCAWNSKEYIFLSCMRSEWTLLNLITAYTHTYTYIYTYYMYIIRSPSIICCCGSSKINLSKLPTKTITRQIWSRKTPATAASAKSLNIFIFMYVYILKAYVQTRTICLKQINNEIDFCYIPLVRPTQLQTHLLPLVPDS